MAAIGSSDDSIHPDYYSGMKEGYKDGYLQALEDVYELIQTDRLRVPILFEGNCKLLGHAPGVIKMMKEGYKVDVGYSGYRCYHCLDTKRILRCRTFGGDGKLLSEEYRDCSCTNGECE